MHKLYLLIIGGAFRLLRRRKQSPYIYYLFITYIVTSKPNLISVAIGLVHMFSILYIIVRRYKAEMGA